MTYMHATVVSKIFSRRFFFLKKKRIVCSFVYPLLIDSLEVFLSVMLWERMRFSSGVIDQVR